MAWDDRAYNSENAYGRPRLVFPMPSWLTLSLIAACSLVFLIQALTSRYGAFASPLVEWGGLTFAGGRAFYQPWRWLTYPYLHESGWSIFFNLITIYFFVPMLERMWGWKLTLLFYTVGAIAVGIAAGLIGVVVGQSIGLIGATGAVLSVLGALTAIAPNTQLMAMAVLPMTMRTLALLITVLYCFTIIGDRNWMNAAHLSGLAFGYAAARFGPTLAGAHWPFPTSSFGDDEPISRYTADLYKPEPRRRKLNRRVIKKARRLAQRSTEEQKLVDLILAKVSAQGMASLSWRERRVLRKATEHQRRSDADIRRTAAR